MRGSLPLSLCLGSILIAAGFGPFSALAVECTYVAPSEDQLAALNVQPDALRIKSFKADSAPIRPEPVAFASTGGRPSLDVDGFFDELDAKLRASVAGFTMQLRRDGSPIRSKSWQWAKRPNDNSLPWKNTQSMHIASISKLITAMAMVKLLDEKKIPHDARIADYLPARWAAGPNVEKITFANLLTHKSGFQWRENDSGSGAICEDISYSDYGFMKSRVAKGVSSLGHFCYANMNFGLQRILIPIINGDIDRAAALSDQEWDDKTFDAYRRYMTRTIFTPAHVTKATLVRPSNNALAYNVPPTAAGWNTGKLACLAGAAGWNMSVEDVLDIMGTFRRGDTIMSAAAAQEMLNDGFGIDGITPVRNGNLYSKTGYWYRTARDSNDVYQMEQSLAVFLPDGMELAIFANSRVAPPGLLLISVVRSVYQRHVSLN